MFSLHMLWDILFAKKMGHPFQIKSNLFFQSYRTTEVLGSRYIGTKLGDDAILI
jgi:hypothetical protein